MRIRSKYFVRPYVLRSLRSRGPEAAVALLAGRWTRNRMRPRSRRERRMGVRGRWRFGIDRRDELGVRQIQACVEFHGGASVLRAPIRR